MTIGIYSIFLGEPEKYYIGQSVDIERRCGQHKSLLTTNSHSNIKMQNAFNTTSTFVSSVILECKSTELDDREIECMNQLNTLEKGYNLVSGGKSGRGIEHGSCKYTEEQITNAFLLLLDPNNSFEFISEITELSISSIRHLSRRETHKWLDELYPEESIKLLNIRDNRIRISINSASKKHKFTKLKSPSNIIYEVVPTISVFSRLHGLDSNKVGAVLLGNRKSHKGWMPVLDKVENG
jgi:GIY-YIG catalytic domain